MVHLAGFDVNIGITEVPFKGVGDLALRACAFGCVVGLNREILARILNW